MHHKPRNQHRNTTYITNPQIEINIHHKPTNKNQRKPQTHKPKNQYTLGISYETNVLTVTIETNLFLNRLVQLNLVWHASLSSLCSTVTGSWVLICRFWTHKKSLCPSFVSNWVWKKNYSLQILEFLLQLEFLFIWLLISINIV